MKTQRDYYFGGALTGTATILQCQPSDKGLLVALDRTIFVPQGGGQPCDLGTIGGSPVLHVEAGVDDPEILWHLIQPRDGIVAGLIVELRIDPDRRRLNSRLHSGGHLLAALVEQALGGAAKACGGHHWPSGEARVEFICETSPGPELQSQIETAISNAIHIDHIVRASLADDGNRYVQIGNYPLMRCGGTHVARLQELGSIVLRSVKHKKGRLRVGYDVTEGNGRNHHGA